MGNRIERMLSRSLHCKDTTDFWKGVRGIKDSRVPLATKVGDAVGDANITKLWQDHFSALLNSVQNERSKPFVCESIDRDMHNEDTIVITAPDVRECLKTIKLGKAAGLDGLAAEHFVFFAQYYLCTFVLIIYEYPNSWLFACISHEIFYCSHIEEQTR